MAAHTAANYNVDLQNCLNTFPQPPDCYERTFGLTLPNSTGGTNILTPNAGVLLGPDVAAAAAAKAAMDAAAAVAAKPAATTSPTSTPAPGAQTPQTTTQTSGGSGAPGGSTSGASVPSDKTIYWILGGGTLAVILFFMVTR